MSSIVREYSCLIGPDTRYVPRNDFSGIGAHEPLFAMDFCRRKRKHAAWPRKPKTALVGYASGLSMTTSGFTAVIKIRNGNPFILVSAFRAKAIKPGWRKPLPVLVRLNGKPATAWRINMMPAGDGSFYLYLHGDARKASGTTVGDRVRVEIDFDATYRNGPQHPMPGWFKQALAENPQAMKNWTALIPSRKKEILRYFSRLNSPDARARNVAKALHVLSGKTGRFMARAWKNGA
jgi:Bacteriocin-protection, YdeI or OmpD-Associated/Domain of unknown function (DUF1905)